MTHPIPQVSGRVHPDLLTMTDEQLMVLNRMSADLGYPMRDIAADTGITLPRCHAIIKHFHAIGLTGYGPLFDEDSSKIMGRGYWLAAPGYELQKQARKLAGWRWFSSKEPGYQGDPA